MYKTKKERHQKADKLRELAKEQRKLWAGAINLYGYSGSAYRYKVEDANQIHERMVQLYLEDE